MAVGSEVRHEVVARVLVEVMLPALTDLGQRLDRIEAQLGTIQAEMLAMSAGRSR